MRLGELHEFSQVGHPATQGKVPSSLLCVRLKICIRGKALKFMCCTRLQISWHYGMHTGRSLTCLHAVLDMTANARAQAANRLKTWVQTAQQLLSFVAHWPCWGNCQKNRSLQFRLQLPSSQPSTKMGTVNCSYVLLFLRSHNL